MKTKIIILLLLFFSGELFSQDLYNYEKSIKFAEYLYSTNQFEFAAKEFERCIFLKPDDQHAILSLFKIFRETGEFDKALSIAHFNNYVDSVPAFGMEYFKLLIQKQEYDKAGLLLSKNDYFKDKINLQLSVFLLQHEWKKSALYRDNNRQNINKLLSGITDKGLLIRKKSPWLAGIFSAIVPGSGKVYAGRWKDGLVSFLMTTSTGFVAARGIIKNNKNVYPWIMGSMSVVYYSGNIYGSTQLAKKINKIKEDELVNQVLDFVLRN